MRVLTESFMFLSKQCDRYGAWRPADLLTCMQEMAGRHAALLGFDRARLLEQGVIWVLIRNEYKLFESPAIGDTVIASTFPGTPRRTLYPRYHEFRRQDGSLLAVGAGGWTLADIHTHRMAHIPAISQEMPDTSDLTPPMGYPDAVRLLPGQPRVVQREIQYTDFDINQHVNNTRCGDWALDMLGDERLKGHFVSRFVANYDREILESGPVTLSLCQEGSAFSLRCEKDGQRMLDCGGELSPIL